MAKIRATSTPVALTSAPFRRRLPSNQSIPRAPSPGVGLGRGAARAREDLIELRSDGLVELDLDRAKRAFELFLRTWANDRRRHRGVVQHPGARDIRGLLTQGLAELLVAFEPRAVLLEGALRHIATAAAVTRLV